MKSTFRTSDQMLFKIHFSRRILAQSSARTYEFDLEKMKIARACRAHLLLSVHSVNLKVSFLDVDEEQHAGCN